MNVDLSVNFTPVKVEGFVQQFIGNVVTALVNSLKDSGTEGDIKISLRGDNVDIVVDGTEIQMKAFVGDFIKNTVIGMVSSLKGVEQIDSLDINIIR
ncbi:hypothetical protein ACFLYB_02130 [Chloroflexota bacterium]